MPPAPSATCRYLTEWTATKLCWVLSADQAEIDTLNVYAGGPCSESVVHSPRLSTVHPLTRRTEIRPRVL
ncbi:hypothetical protein [Streptomyces sp. NPDC057695]|uniref:hypothetical protein n=1 Tax=Streptomyces sp. NPDC057695 TaxID=3346217 RepID=UPI0036C20CE8